MYGAFQLFLGSIHNSVELRLINDKIRHCEVWVIAMTMESNGKST